MRTAANMRIPPTAPEIESAVKSPNATMRPAAGAPAPGRELHRHLADAFGLRAQRRRDRRGQHRAAADDSSVPASPSGASIAVIAVPLDMVQCRAAKTGGGQEDGSDRRDGDAAGAVGQPARERRGREHAEHVDARRSRQWRAPARVSAENFVPLGDGRHDGAGSRERSCLVARQAR
jgi:hypothetical protein